MSLNSAHGSQWRTRLALWTINLPPSKRQSTSAMVKPRVTFCHWRHALVTDADKDLRWTFCIVANLLIERRSRQAQCWYQMRTLYSPVHECSSSATHCNHAAVQSQWPRNICNSVTISLTLQSVWGWSVTGWTGHQWGRIRITEVEMKKELQPVEDKDQHFGGSWWSQQNMSLLYVLLSAPWRGQLGEK